MTLEFFFRRRVFEDVTSESGQSPCSISTRAVYNTPQDVAWRSTALMHGSHPLAGVFTTGRSRRTGTGYFLPLQGKNEPDQYRRNRTLPYLSILGTYTTVSYALSSLQH